MLAPLVPGQVGIDPTRPIRRAPSLVVELRSNNSVECVLDGRRVLGGSHTLAVLDAFARPRTLADALPTFTPPAGSYDWIQLTTTIVNLYQAGILRDEGETIPAFRADDRGAFDGQIAHVEMLNDRARTSAFLAAVAEVVRPGDVVVDLGTGTGVLAVAAARAGAEHVYAIEASGIGQIAARVFEANGLADRVTLLEGWSAEVDLPRKADVLVTETIGNEPLDERILEHTIDARSRFLRPDARLVPRAIQIYAIPYELATADIERRRVTPAGIEAWQSWYGIDFSPLAEAARNTAQRTFVKPAATEAWTALAEPVMLAQLDLGTVEVPRVEASAIARVAVSGQIDGVLVFFDCELSNGVRLSTNPALTSRESSWRCPLWTYAEPLSLEAGDEFTLTYRYRVPDHANGVRITASPEAQ